MQKRFLIFISSFLFFLGAAAQENFRALTGLCLSLAYDIVSNAHGGELKLESAVGKGSECIIHLSLDIP